MPPNRELTDAELAFENLFAKQPPAASSDNYHLLEGIEYPPPGAAHGAEADPATFKRALLETRSWLPFVLSDHALPQQEPKWFALRKSPFGPEALFAGWTRDRRWVQVATTTSIIIVRTEIGPLEDPSEPKLIERVLQLAARTLNGAAVSPETYSLRRIGDFLCGRAELPDSAGWKALTFATDGIGVKFSCPKTGGSSAVKAPGLPPERDPWFPPEEPPNPSPARRSLTGKVAGKKR